MSASPRRVVAFVTDLMFVSQIRASVAAAGAVVDFFQLREGSWESRVVSSKPDLILVDLDQPGVDVEASLRRIRSVVATIPMIGFAPHVAVELTRQAREAGCTSVLTRSEFKKRLDDLLHKAS